MPKTFRGTVTEVLDREIDYYIQYKIPNKGEGIFLIGKHEALNMNIIKGSLGKSIAVTVGRLNEGVTRVEIAGRRVLDRCLKNTP
jgi:hypothetical protein